MIPSLISALTNTQKKSGLKEMKTLGDISYLHITNSRSRTYKLKVDPKKGVVLVTPPRFSQSKIDSFLTQNTAWIKQNHAKMINKKEYFESATEIRIFDTLYQKIIRVDPTKPSSVLLGEPLLAEEPQLNALAPARIESRVVKNHINKGHAQKDQTNIPSLIITVPTDSDLKITQTINRFLQQTAQQYVVPRTQQLAKKMATEYTSITFGEHKSQWGSCHISGKLTFNWRLVHAPIEIIDSVIVHELAHRTHHNHSAAFWALVAKFNPNYKQHSLWLKRRGVSVG